MSAHEAAAAYIAEGWRIVPVAHGEKAPSDKGWPDNVYTAEHINGGNVGVILGPVSRGLVDVDLDAHWAMQLAPYYLPKTATFGHASKPGSHWLYYCEGLRSQRFSFERANKVELVELRGQNASSDRCGHQSVFPGSTHSSGEPIEWDDAGGSDEIATVERGALIWAATRLSVACVIVDGWVPGSQRNNKCRAWAAGLLALGWTPDEVRHTFQAVFDVAQVEDDQRAKDDGAVERTIEAFERGDKLLGFGSLVKDGLVDAKVVRRVETLARTPDTLAREAKLAQSNVGAELKTRIMREAQSVDALGELQDSAALLFKSAAETPGVSGAQENFFGRLLNMTEKAKKLEYVCESLCIAPGKVTAVVGYSGTSKGPFLNQLALCIASGKPFLGQPVARRKVAFFDFETGQLLDDRVWRLNNALGNDRQELASGEWIEVYHSQRLIDDAWLAAFRAGVEPGMVCFIDSYTSAVRGDMNESQYALMLWELGKISDAMNVTIVIAMHSRKKQSANKGSSLLEQVAGSGALSAAMQTAILLLRPDEDKPNVIGVRCGRAPEEPFAPFDLVWSDVQDPQTPSVLGQKWGLLAKRLEREAAVTLVEQTKTWEQEVKDIEAVLLSELAREYPKGLKCLVSDLTRAGNSRTRPIRRAAIRNMVQRGALLANFHWRTEVKNAKQVVWLPGVGAQAGFVQD